jgi:hypothetical protein
MLLSPGQALLLLVISNPDADSHALLRLNLKHRYRYFLKPEMSFW